jgi:hypothetical protein
LCILYFCISKIGGGDVYEYFSDEKYEKHCLGRDNYIITNTDTNIDITIDFYRSSEEATEKQFDFARIVLNNENKNIEKILNWLKPSKIEIKLEIKSLYNIQNPLLYIHIRPKGGFWVFIKYSTSDTYIIYWDSGNENRAPEPFNTENAEILKNKIDDLIFITKMPEAKKFNDLLADYHKFDINCEISFLKHYIPIAVYVEEDIIYKKLLEKYKCRSLERLYEYNKITIYNEDVSEHCNIPLYIYRISNIGTVGELMERKDNHEIKNDELTDYKVDYKIVNGKVISTPRKVIDYTVLDDFINFVNSLFNCIKVSSKTLMFITNQRGKTILRGDGNSNGGFIVFQFDLGDPNNYILNIYGSFRDQIIFTDTRTLREQLIARHPLIFNRSSRLMG